MRVLIVTAAVLACAAAVPSGLLAHGLASPYGFGHGLAVAHAPVVHAAPLAVAAPTISPGDIHGAVIDAHVDASDHARAAVDAAREYHDQHSELHGQAINAAEDHSWQAVDAVKTQEAQLDGAAAGAAPILAKQIAGHGVAGYAHAAPAYGHIAPLAYAGPLGYGAGYAGHGLAGSKTVVTQSLSQSHPAPLVHAASVYHGAPLVHAAPLAYGHGLGHGFAHGW